MSVPAGGAPGNTGFFGEIERFTGAPGATQETIGIEAVPAADVQLLFVSVTDNSMLPLTPAVNTIDHVPCPDVNVPFLTVQLYVDPLFEEPVFAVNPVWFGFALDTAYTVGAGGGEQAIVSVTVGDKEN